MAIGWGHCLIQSPLAPPVALRMKTPILTCQKVPPDQPHLPLPAHPLLLPKLSALQTLGIHFLLPATGPLQGHPAPSGFHPTSLSVRPPSSHFSSLRINVPCSEKSPPFLKTNTHPFIVFFSFWSFPYKFFLPFYFFNWRIFALQNFAVFCQTSTRINHRYTYAFLSFCPPSFFPSLYPSLLPSSLAFFIFKKTVTELLQYAHSSRNLRDKNNPYLPGA